LVATIDRSSRVARTVDAIDLPIPLEEAFDYVADFSRTAERDPGVAEAKRLTPGCGPPRIRDEARLELSGLGRLADPFLDVLFQRFWSVAVRGLRERMAGRVSQADRVPRAGTRVRESHRSGSKRSRIPRNVGKPHTQEGAS
jgi:hypothetical protein